MRNISADELKTILEKHALWRSSGGAEGERANLAGANLAGANLAGANLADADLARAYLADADLARAYLAGANLADADLADANLADAYLARAYLAGANLADAYLAYAYLAYADLAGANLAGAYLARAYLADADLARAYLAGANLAGASGLDEEAKPLVDDSGVPTIERLNTKILAAVDGAEALGTLDMSQWHTCDTTHCLAGWAIHLAGKPGYELEQKVGPRMAGAMIFRKSTGRAPHFFAPNDRALNDLRKRAAEEAAKMAG